MPGQLRIACIGGESTGKTTLATALAASVSGVVVSEVLREFVTAHGRPPLAHEQRAILEQQRARESQCAASHPQAVIVCDPATTMIAIYSALYFEDDSLDSRAQEYARDYDVLLWCRPDIPWVAEPGQHDGPQFRARADALLQSWVSRQAGQIPVLEITGEQGRIELAQRLLKACLGSVWQPSATAPPT
ncbi:MAG: ATP-binding protein [Actinomycetota bacterium]|nr:ATP-binding protein [Actinomycetota bacterium]